MRDEHEMTAQEYWQLSDDIDAGLYMMEHPSHPRAVPLTPAHTQALAERREAFLRMMRRGNSTQTVSHWYRKRPKRGGATSGDINER